MALLLTEDDIATLLNVADCIEAVEQALARLARGEASNQPRRRLRGPGTTMQQMEAVDHQLGRFATKTYVATPRGVKFLVQLWDVREARLLALVEADRLGQIRTGAASGVATRWMARPDASTLAVFGSGWQAETQVLAMAAVRPIQHIRIYSPTEANRVRFASHIHQQVAVDAHAVASPEEAIDGADIVVTATTSGTPVFDGSFLPAGIHVNAMGSNGLTRAEIDGATVTRAAVVAVDSVAQAQQESGDLMPVVEAGRFRWEQAVELGRIAAGQAPGRTSPDDITLFESLGLGIEDLAAASLAYDLAVERGTGREIPLFD